MTIQQLRYFHTACRYKSISRAAEQLHVSQPSVSMAIRELEREFGYPLLLRCYKGFVLTEEGRTLEDLAGNFLRHADQLSGEMLSFGKKQRPIRMGIPPMIGTAVLPTFYSELRRNHPNILFTTVEAGTKTLIQNLRENTLDLAILSHGDPLPQEFDSVTIATTQVFWCALPEHPLAKGQTVTPALLEKEPLVFFASSFSVYDYVLRRFRESNISPQILHMTSQFSTMESMLRSGIASGFMLHFLAKKYPDLVAIPFLPAVELEISLVWRKNEVFTDSMKTMIEFCQQEKLTGCLR